MPRVAIIGGGLGGLAAAVSAARAGAEVRLFEAAASFGGRAQTQVRDGFALNLGPHALYADGPGMAVLRGLSIAMGGAAPPVSGGLAVHGGALDVLPGDARGILATRLLSLADKVALATRGLALVDARSGATWGEALAQARTSPRGRTLLAALARLATYMDDPAACAVAVRSQLAHALTSGVIYLHGGWGRLVDALVTAARDAGATLDTDAPIEVLEAHATGLTVRRAGGEALRVDAVVLATPPAEAARLAPELADHAERTRPIRLAHLDVGLARLPEPRRIFALGIDRPTYFSVHSAVAAHLAPEGAALIHAGVYLAPGQEARRVELEAMLDLVQPGWREGAVVTRFLPGSPVAYDTPLAARGGLAGRHSGRVRERVFTAGDWVGPTGLLADAAFASGARAGLEAAAINS